MIYPREWEDIQEQQVGEESTVKQVEKDSDEWCKVLTRFQKTLPKMKITEIVRIQNKSRWIEYTNEVSRITKKYKGEKPKIKYLYHGTGKTKPEMVIQSEEGGFDITWASVGMWGKANYFAVNSAYSHMYRHEPTKGTY